MRRERQSADQQERGQCAPQAAYRIDAARTRFRFGQKPADGQRDQCQRRGGYENPPPVEMFDDEAPQCRCHCIGSRNDHAVDPQPAAQALGRIDGPQHRRRHSQCDPRAEALQYPHRNQMPEAVDQQRSRGCEEEDDLADLIQTPVPDPITNRGEGQQHHHHHELIHGDDARYRAIAYRKIARDCRQGDIGDGAVHDEQGRSETDCADRPDAARHRQPVHLEQAGRSIVLIDPAMAWPGRLL